ncbi:hypothetical protein RU639_013366 [Aspergillus parasiticus]
MPMTHDEDEKDWKVYLGSLFPSSSYSKRSIVSPFLRTSTPPLLLQFFRRLPTPFHDHLSLLESCGPPRSSIEKGLRKYVLHIQLLLALASIISSDLL